MHRKNHKNLEVLISMLSHLVSKLCLVCKKSTAIADNFLCVYLMLCAVVMNDKAKGVFHSKKTGKMVKLKA